MKKQFKVTLLESGIGIEYGEEKFVVSYQAVGKSWEEGRKWAEQQGGSMPTLEQAVIVHEYRDVINKALAEAGREEISGWHWTSREYPANERCAWAVHMYYGRTGWSSKRYYGQVRAVTAFPEDL